MSDFVVDFTDVKGGDFDAIPGGTYEAVFEDWDETETKNEGKIPAGTPGINWEFTITQEGEYENRKLWTNHWIHPKTLGFLKTAFKASGRFTDEELESDSFDIAEAADRALGAPVRLKVAKREYPKGSGDYVNDIKSIKPARSGDADESASMLP